MRILLVALLCVGCHKADQHPVDPGSGSAPPPADASITVADDAAVVGTAKQHEKCSPSAVCTTGLTCVTYHGIGGNELASCEIPCASAACPADQHCTTIADGPGRVCVAGAGGAGSGSGGGSGSGSATGDLPAQGKPCRDGACAKSLTCVEYFGIAGPSGPKFTSCEIPCPGGKGCPKAQQCVTIADGPGQVCRAKH